MESRILDFIMENSNRHLDNIQFNDSQYIKIHNELKKKFKVVNRMKLSKKQNRAIDELLTSYNEENCYCCKIIYEQGFKDCISLLKEIKVI